MIEKGEEMGGGGGGGEERALEYGFMGGGGGGFLLFFRSYLGKGRRLQIPNIPGDEWENRSTLGKNPLVG